MLWLNNFQIWVINLNNSTIFSSLTLFNFICSVHLTCLQTLCSFSIFFYFNINVISNNVFLIAFIFVMTSLLIFFHIAFELYFYIFITEIIILLWVSKFNLHRCSFLRSLSFKTKSIKVNNNLILICIFSLINFQIIKPILIFVIMIMLVSLKIDILLLDTRIVY